MKKRYLVQYDWTYDMNVTIDHSIMTDEKLHEMNNFWSGAEDRLREAGGDITKAVLKMLALRAFIMTVTELDPEGMFRRGEVEGWYPMDGSEGIWLTHLDQFELDEDEITVKETE
jgi:hypothetical protein